MNYIGQLKSFWERTTETTKLLEIVTLKKSVKENIRVKETYVEGHSRSPVTTPTIFGLSSEDIRLATNKASLPRSVFVSPRLCS